MRILVTNIGRRIYFAQFLVDLKKKIKNCEIYLADNNLNVSGLKINEARILKIPKVEDGNNKYLKAIKKIIIDKKISILIPCTNYDLNILSLNVDKIKKLGCHIMVSNNSLVNKCLDKKKLFDLSIKYNFNSPKIFLNLKEAKKSKTKVFIRKLRNGYASIGQKVIKKLENKDFKKNYIIQEYIYGDEFHLDILNDHNGKFLSSSLKKKISMRYGETDIAKVVNNHKINILSKNLSKNLKHIGNLDCDIIYDKKKKLPYIIDINPRFGGGYAFTHISGENFLAKYIYNLIGKKFKNKKKISNKIYSKGIALA